MAGMSLNQVATAAETSPAYLSKVENGKFIPSDQYVGKVTAAIAARLRVSA